MRSSLAFVEANTTGTGMLALDRARQLGLRPVFVTSRPERYRGLAERDVDVVVCDTNRLAAIVARLDPARLAGITTTSEFYLPTVAELAARYGLPGNPPATMRRCRDKAAVRAALAAAGVRQPRYATVSTVDDVAAAVAAVGLPCVVKPVDDSGSTGVRLCVSEAEVRDHVTGLLAVRVNVRDQPRAGLALVEEYLTGPEYSVELFGSGDTLTCIGVTEKTVVGAPWFVEAGHVFPAPLPPADATAISDHARRAVTALGADLGATHTEIRLTPDGPALVEINARLAGGMIPELIQLATGLDLLGQQVRVAAGLPTQLAATRQGNAGIAFLFAPAAGTLTAVDGVAEARAVPGITHVTVTAAPGAAVSPARDAYQRLGYLIAAGPTDAAVRDSLAAGRALIRVAVGEPATTR